MKPATLEEWNIGTIMHLLVQGYHESETFDFKEMLPHKDDERGKQRTVKTCCAFANSSGGFLIYGVKDATTGGSIEGHLAGIDPADDFPEQFGNYPQKCTPSITWDFKNPPVKLENGNVIHVIHVPRSWNAPHCIEAPNNLRCFPKRTNKGNEDMSYEEIRMAFLQYYEKRLKLQLLQAELKNIKQHAEDLTKTYPDAQVKFGVGEFSLTVIETVLADTYTILAEHRDLLEILDEIRNHCRVANNLLQMFSPIAFPWTGNNVEPHPAIEKHNRNIGWECGPIISACTRALERLGNVLAL